ncbi:MAG: hypothetical protein AB7V62_09435 [Thermoleophilia bacterium]
MRQPLPPRIHAAVLAVAARLDAAGVRWCLGGSAGRALLGHAVRPRDVDVEVAVADAAAAGRALGVALRHSAGAGRSSLRGGTVLAGVEVDVTAGFAATGPELSLDPLPDDQLIAGPRAPLAGREILLAPPEEAVARALVLGDWDRLARIARGAGPGAAPLRADQVARRLSSATSRASR